MDVLKYAPTHTHERRCAVKQRGGEKKHRRRIRPSLHLRALIIKKRTTKLNRYTWGSCAENNQCFTGNRNSGLTVSFRSGTHKMEFAEDMVREIFVEVSKWWHVVCFGCSV